MGDTSSTGLQNLQIKHEKSTDRPYELASVSTPNQNLYNPDRSVTIKEDQDLNPKNGNSMLKVRSGDLAQQKHNREISMGHDVDL